LSRVFLLEDHSWFRKALAQLLEREPDLQVIGEAGSLSEARDDVMGFCCSGVGMQSESSSNRGNHSASIIR
jgi:DNA-binding NarL/FixJ family response regulator